MNAFAPPEPPANSIPFDLAKLEDRLKYLEMELIRLGEKLAPTLPTLVVYREAINTAHVTPEEMRCELAKQISHQASLVEDATNFVTRLIIECEL